MCHCFTSAYGCEGGFIWKTGSLKKDMIKSEILRWDHPGFHLGPKSCVRCLDMRGRRGRFEAQTERRLYAGNVETGVMSLLRIFFFFSFALSWKGPGIRHSKYHGWYGWMVLQSRRIGSRSGWEGLACSGLKNEGQKMKGLLWISWLKGNLDF